MLETGDVREAEPVYAVPQGEAADGPAGERWRIAHYGPRFFALYEGDDLVAVTVYKRGAESVRDRLQAQEDRMAALTRALGTRQGEGSAVERVREERESRRTRER
jgi:hypothetical protein